MFGGMNLPVRFLGRGPRIEPFMMAKRKLRCRVCYTMAKIKTRPARRTSRGVTKGRSSRFRVMTNFRVDTEEIGNSSEAMPWTFEA
uniref:Uncharacterized protein n=1 Tax=Candidatus Kentrum sp. MB TaxID=2138164 RepID=A0A450XZS9_9GAMM|nr:MAG: hypothetical protein BECKMB1821G_GA0114241_10802 [Candidatus Kentron sp. MB]VFK34776.1 MAG: hypothetical protein BECKMB1821I_GA0114274_10842 [Candidatus Kentron sp. MB]VFK76939.1 MAG: hypothetical protein BECKMB1821H_GA0114242_10852 [Candidatus Kentron sp. MB]